MTKSVVYRKGAITIGNRPLVARTCHVCGLILGKKHYQKKTSTWANVCNSCSAKRQDLQGTRSHGDTLAYYHKSQSESLETATRKGVNWTLSELDLIVELLNSGHTLRQIAPQLNRSLGGIRGAVAAYGLRNNWPTREQWIITLA